MKALLIGLVGFAAWLSAQPSQTPPKPDDIYRQLTVDAVKHHLQNKGAVYLLDVREPKELEEVGAIEGAVNIPLGQLLGRIDEVSKDKPVLVICRMGMRAARAAVLLENNGLRLAGAAGILAWKEQGNPVVYPKASVEPK